MAQGKTPFIDATTAADAFDESQKWMKPFFEPIDEFERIARNKPSPKIPEGLPKITDGTMAAIIQEDPKRIVQTTPTGLVTSISHPEYSKPADIILRQELIPKYNRMGSMIQKSWNMISRAKTVGRATSYTFLCHDEDDIRTDFIIPYTKDIIDEKGKVFAGDNNIRFMRSWYTLRDLKAILNSEQARQKKNKSYASDWDLKLLANMINSSPTAKPAEQQTPAEREKSADAGGYEVIHVFQNGIGAEYYSFAPRFEAKKMLRVKVSSDPRGRIPLDDLYNNVDGSNPMGRGQVELSGGVQNLMDQQMQMFQYMSLMEMAPPMKVFGNINASKLPMKPQAYWKMGSQAAGNDVVPLTISNFALQGYTPNAQFLQSKIFQLNNSQDSSIPSASGNTGQSKTQAGVEMSAARLGVSDNYVRQQFEGWFERQSETSLNIYFSEEKRTRLIDLDKEDLQELSKTKAASMLTKEGKLEVKFANIKDIKFKFTVNAGSSEVKEDAENVDKLIQTMELAKQTPSEEVMQKIPGLFKLIVKEIGAEGVDELFPEDQTDENGQPIQQPQAPAGPDPEQLMQMVQQVAAETVQQALQEEKANKPQPDPMLDLIKALGLKYDQLPAEARAIVLETTGLGTGSDDPVQTKHDLEKLSALQSAEEFERGPEEKEADRQFQREQSQAQAQSQQNGQSSGPSQSEGQQTPAPDPLTDSITPDEEQVVSALTDRGFTEDDIEQAIVMLRQGMPLEQVIPTIAAKYQGVA